MITSNGIAKAALANESAAHRLVSPAVAEPPPHCPPDAPVGCTHWAVTAAAVSSWEATGVGAAARPGAEDDAGGHPARDHWADLLLLDRCAAEGAVPEPSPAERHVLDPAIRSAVTTLVVAARAPHWFDPVPADPPGPGRPWFAEIGYVHCFALLMAGQVRHACRIAENGYRHELAAGNTALADGWLAMRGRVADTVGAPHPFEGPAPRLMLAPRPAALAVFGDRGADQDRRHENRLFLPWSTLSRAWATAAGGNTTLAARQALAAADTAMALGQYAVEATASYDAARLGNPHAVRHRLAALADLVPGPVVPTLAAAAAALARSDPAALDLVAEKFTELGMDLLAAEAVTAAAALRRTCAPPRTLACPTATTPLLQLTAPLVDLTSRERDVVLLAAGGFTSPVIGHRLALSARTVDNYLGRAYQKLGVANRRELGPLVVGDRTQPPIHAEGKQR
ncbi:helix-turn-helix domain-containing protein [Kitasatospora phosalacinea]|uniref:helix-turn-helix domain-containing protein n=1 Tax=Kitasatospora phosalacinea TaxID=2065 RepID=UPI0012FEA9FC|nr:helix-turn-helix transcriptional regulator [Kitasatospora phosalacinea]